MSIDPEKFEPQGAPTREQVRVVWDAHPKPSARKVAEVMTGRGFSISWRTIARWKKHHWQEELSRTIAEKANEKVKAEFKQIAADVTEASKIGGEGGIEGAISGGGLKEDDIARIAKRIDALSVETKESLLLKQENARLIMNIVLMEETARRAHIMVLIPKDTGAFVGEVNEAAGALAPVAPIDHPPDHHHGYTNGHANGDGAKLIEGRTLSPLSLKLAQLREESAA